MSWDANPALNRARDLALDHTVPLHCVKCGHIGRIDPDEEPDEPYTCLRCVREAQQLKAWVRKVQEQARQSA